MDGRLEGNYEPESRAELSRMMTLQVATGERTARKITRWVGAYMKFHPAFSSADRVSMHVHVSERLSEWADNPESAMESIRAEDPILGLSPVKKGDEWDFRVP